MTAIIRSALNAFFGLLGTKMWLWWMDHGGDPKDDAEEKLIEEGKG
jgi:hypothetical protein